MRIDHAVDIEEGHFDDNMVTSSYFLKYVQDATHQKCIQTIYYNEEFTGKVNFQSISNFKDWSETIYMYDDKSQEQTCQIHQYTDKLFDILYFYNLLWRPSELRVTEYLGPMCADPIMQNLHGFVSSDSVGNQFTAFFDDETMRPVMIKYMTQTLLMRPQDLIPRTHFSKKDFPIEVCTDDEGELV